MLLERIRHQNVIVFGIPVIRTRARKRIFLGDGAGGLTPIASFVQGTGSVADMNGDGILDYVTVMESGDGIGSSLFVNVGNGDGTFQRTFSVGLNGNKLGGVPVIGDFNGDGKLDVAVPIFATYVAVFLGNGDGTLQNEIDYTVANPGSLAVADVNGDGILDIVTSGVSVLLGKGNGTFTSGISILLPNGDFGNLQLGDVNGDGKLDLATVTIDSNSNQTVNILLGQGGGAFQSPITFAAGQSPLFPPVFGMADFNNDGKLDFAVSGQSTATVFLQTE